MKPPLPFAPAKTNLDLSNAVECSLCDEDIIDSAGKVLTETKGKVKSKHKIPVHAGGSAEDLLKWSTLATKVLRRKPCDTAASLFNAFESLLAGAAFASFKDVAAKFTSQVAQNANLVTAGQSFATFNNSFKHWVK